jgi:hypothetical protein
MKRKRHTPEQIVKKLRTAGEEQARGTSIEEVCRKLEISVATYHRWNKEYSGAPPRGRRALVPGLRGGRTPGLPGDRATEEHATIRTKAADEGPLPDC